MRQKLVLSLFVLFVSICLVSGSAFGQAKEIRIAHVYDKTGKKAEKKGEIIDINSASKQELMSLPGIGDAYSQKIIDNRPYRGKNDLVRKNIIPQATYDKISGQIIAKQDTAKNATKKK